MTTAGSRTVAVFGLPAATAAAYVALFAVAFAFYSLAWRSAPVQEGDSPQYLEVARDLSDLRLDALHNRTPGYPVLLALTGSASHPTRALFRVSLLLHFASIWLLAAVLRAAGAGGRSLLAFGVLLLMPLYVEPAGYVMTENLAQFALAAGFAGLVLWFAGGRAVLLAVSSVAFAYAALTRPAYQGLAVGVAALLVAAHTALRDAWFGAGRVMRAAAALVVGSLVILGAFSYANERSFHYLGVSPLMGFHLSTKTMTFVERAPDEYAAVREILVKARDAELTKRGGTHSPTQAVWHAQAELAAATGLSMPELSRYLLRMNLRLIRAAPLEYIGEVARSAATYWLPASTDLANMHSGVLRGVWALVHAAVTAVFWLQIVVMAGVAGLWLRVRRADGLPRVTLRNLGRPDLQALAYGVAAAIVFYTMALSCVLDIGEPRQRRSTDVLIVFMCFLGAHVWRRAKPHADAPPPGGVTP